jgi:cytochrome c556
MLRIIIAGVLFGFISMFATTEVFAQSDVNDQRQKLMKSQSADAKAIKGAIEAKDYATIEAKAKDLMGTSDRIVASFPKGSTTGKTRATPAIWEKSDDFAKYAKTLNKQAGELAAAAKAQNDAEIGVKFKALGDTCNSCHKDFRAAKYSE